MARYSIVSVARSDGRSHYLSNGHPVPNEPPRQDSTPAADGSIDYYQRLQDDDPTSVDWKRKLGGMLMEVIGGPENAGISPMSLLQVIANQAKGRISLWGSSQKTMCCGSTVEPGPKMAKPSQILADKILIFMAIHMGRAGSAARRNSSPTFFGSSLTEKATPS